MATEGPGFERDLAAEGPTRCSARAALLIAIAASSGLLEGSEHARQGVHAPVLGVAPVLESHDVDHLDHDRLVGRRHAQQRPAVWWRFRTGAGAALEISPSTIFSVNDPRGAIDVARQGLGLVLAPVDAVADDRRPLVQLKPDFGEPEPIDLHVVYPTRRLLPRRARLAIDHLVREADPGGESRIHS